MKRILLAVLVSLFPLAALAQGTTGPGSDQEQAPVADSDSANAKAAKEVLTRYLDLVKAKKWAPARKMVHPNTLKVIAERKKRMGNEDHPMAPAYQAKESYWLKDYKILGASDAYGGTVTVVVSEDNFQVEVKGVAEGERSTYLLGKKDGKWWVVDKKRNSSYSKDSIKLGYKGWFDAPPAKTDEPDEE